jgi:hypothetical protein
MKLLMVFGAWLFGFVVVDITTGGLEFLELGSYRLTVDLVSSTTLAAVVAAMVLVKSKSRSKVIRIDSRKLPVTGAAASVAVRVVREEPGPQAY